jgi:glycosyltransferase involved in cell wall biosynthesis
MLIVGRLDAAQRHKGHDQLLEALPLVRQRVADAQLVVAGDGDDRGRLQARAQALGVADAVTFTGRLSEGALHRLYDQCALFVMPSDGDGFGLVFLEAMMHGLPCAGLRQGAAAEILADGVCGLLVDRDDVPGMAAQLATLLQDEERRRRLGQAGFERYRAEFTGGAHAARLRKLLETELAA